MIKLLPRLRVVLLFGIKAQVAWKLFDTQYAGLVRQAGFEIVSTYHPGRGALQHKDAIEQQRHEDDIRAALSRAAGRLRMTT